MKVFCSYPFTDEDEAVTTARMHRVVDALKAQGNEVYCDRFDVSLDQAQANLDITAIFKKAFTELDSSDALVAVMPSVRRSVGQCMEIGVAYNSNIPIYLFEHESASGTTYLPKLASKTISWKTEEDLVSQLVLTDLSA